MKRLNILVIMLLLPFVLFANTQRLYDASSNEYRLASDLAILAGVVGPSTSLPVTAGEILLALERIDPLKLTPYFREQYKELVNGLTPAEKSFDISIPVRISPQFFLSKEGSERDDFFIPYRDEKPLLGFGLKIESFDNVFLETEIPVMNSPSGTEIPLTSLDFIIGGNTDIYGLMPTLARGSIGTKNLSLIIGRTRHSMGSGIMGNLMVGDNFNYQELMEVKFISNNFNYNIAITHFDTEAVEASSGNEYVEKGHFDGKQQLRVVHRFDLNLFDKARVVVNLGTLLYTSSSFDLRFLIPFHFIHNTYNFSDNPVITAGNHDEANNIISIEVDLPIMRGMTLSLQAMMDQMMLGNEAEKEFKAHTALAGMASLSYAMAIDEAILKLYVEGAYTTPYLYRNAKYNVSTDSSGNTVYTPNYNYDFLLGYFRMTSTGGYAKDLNMSAQQDELEYTGLTPDTIAVQVGAIYTNYSWRLRLNSILRYQVQGANATDRFRYPSYNPEDKGSNDMGVSPSSNAVHTISITEIATWSCSKHVDIYGGFYFGWNFGYIRSFVPQAYFGITLKFL